MTPYFFDSLTKLQQAEILQHQSNYLYTRQEPEFVIDGTSLAIFVRKFISIKTKILSSLSKAFTLMPIIKPTCPSKK